ncbi:alpha/beta hydrolase [Bacillus spongiae]|uniref:Alpha/beta hydrolase n=1 Tax=Bacillus spongiae TaxID=2683610 RepID=A0ABU8HJV6_9BACI
MKEILVKINNNIHINVRYSNSCKETILFLHFSSGNSHMWDGVLSQFKQHYNVIVPDIRGHGKSDIPKKGYHIDDMAQDIYLLLQELNMSKCHIVGSSLGAEIGLSLASSHPSMVKSLICEGALYNEFGQYGLINISENQMKNEIKERYDDLKKFRRPIFDSKKDYIEHMKESLQKRKIWNDHFLPFVEHNILMTKEGKYTNCFPLFAREQYIQHYWTVRFEEYYQTLKCPVLFLPSEEEWNDLKIRKILIEFCSLVEKSEVLCIPKSVHAYMWMQFPFLLSNHIKKFISTIE